MKWFGCGHRPSDLLLHSTILDYVKQFFASSEMLQAQEGAIQNYPVTQNCDMANT